MPWSDLVDQERVISVLRRALSTQRVAHAYLFHGPEGVGKVPTAIAFAQALQCERGGDDACGRCLACSKVARLIHPDVHVLLPYPRETSEKDVASRLQSLAANPYGAVDFVRRPFLDDAAKTSNKQVQYHVSRVHEDLHLPMSYRPAEGRYKVAIITDAHLMRVEAANAFLKLLEEPAERTIFILTTSRVDRLLPTILSRCQQQRFDPLDPEAIERALVDRAGVDADRSAMLARMSGGSFTRALELHEGEDLHEHRELVVAYLRHGYSRSAEHLGGIIDKMSGVGRERAKTLMSLLEVWIRDLVLYRAMGHDAPLVNVDQRKVIADFCDNLPDARLEDMAALVEQARELIERNVNISLLLTALAFRLAAAMRGRSAERLFVPLTDAEASAA